MDINGFPRNRVLLMVIIATTLSQHEEFKFNECGVEDIIGLIALLSESGMKNDRKPCIRKKSKIWGTPDTLNVPSIRREFTKCAPETSSDESIPTPTERNVAEVRNDGDNQPSYSKFGHSEEFNRVGYNSCVVSTWNKLNTVENRNDSNLYIIQEKQPSSEMMILTRYTKQERAWRISQGSRKPFHASNLVHHSC